MIGNLDELRYEGGYPTAESIRQALRQLDLQRAAQAYLDFIPALIWFMSNDEPSD
jgi:hypothetical protein